MRVSRFRLIINSFAGETTVGTRLREMLKMVSCATDKRPIRFLFIGLLKIASKNRKWSVLLLFWSYKTWSNFLLFISRNKRVHLLNPVSICTRHKNFAVIVKFFFLHNYVLSLFYLNNSRFNTIVLVLHNFN